MVETVVYDYEPGQPLKEEDGHESPEPQAGFTTSTPLSTPPGQSTVHTAVHTAVHRLRYTCDLQQKDLR